MCWVKSFRYVRYVCLRRGCVAGGCDQGAGNADMFLQVIDAQWFGGGRCEGWWGCSVLRKCRKSEDEKWNIWMTTPTSGCAGIKVDLCGRKTTWIIMWWKVNPWIWGTGESEFWLHCTASDTILLHSSSLLGCLFNYCFKSSLDLIVYPEKSDR